MKVWRNITKHLFSHQIGSSVTSIISSHLCASIFGWASIYYLFGTRHSEILQYPFPTGVIGLVWILVWLIFSSNSPESNRFISIEETTYLRDAIDRKKVTEMNEYSERKTLSRKEAQFLGRASQNRPQFTQQSSHSSPIASLYPFSR